MNLKVAESVTTYDKGLAELLGDIASDERVAVENFLANVKVKSTSFLNYFLTFSKLDSHNMLRRKLTQRFNLL